MIKDIHIDKPASLQSEDCFQRYEFSKRIASIIATPKIDKSLIVGLYGKWGEGKTSVMNFVQQELPEETVIVNFNPWMFADEQHLLKSFFSILADALGEKINNGKEQWGKIFADYGDAIGDAAEYIPKVGRSIKWLGKLGQKLSTVSVEKLKSRVDKIIRESGKNIVVFVDDIDRLDIQEIQYVFKLVKLVGDFPRTAYVLSFDDEMVSAALALKYGGDKKAAGYNFLEKIIQVPLKIPKASKKALYKYTADLLNSVMTDAGIELNKEEVNDFIEAFNTAFLPFMDNPRMAIRYANTLAFSLPLLNGEVNTGNLIIIEGIKIFYPELYDFIRSNAYLFTQRTGNREYDHEQPEKEQVRNKLSSAIDIYTMDKRTAIIEILQQLFPQLKAVYDNTSFPDSAYTRWKKERKICSAKYFDRYFSYTVQEGDLPDNYFDQLLADLQNNTVESLVTKLSQAVGQYGAFDIVQKFRMQEEELNEIQSENLAMVLAQIGQSFPVEEDIHFATTYAQSANLIARLIRNITAAKRLSLVLKLLTASPSLEYAMEINYWLMYREKNYPTTAIFSEQDEVAIQQHLVTLFKEKMTYDNFFTLVSDGNLWRILAWWSKWDDQKGALKTFWSEHLGRGNNHEFALKLIKVFTPTINASSYNPQNKQVNSSSYKSGFYDANFDALSEVIDVDLLSKNLIAFYGDNPHKEGPSVISARDPIDDKTLVSIFQWFMKNKLVESKLKE
ncbi:P-loop NTPase fold protein [Chitinophaga defluvii]|uniref:P-loop NTPase fold protein n=1 Tax=Chitinophaga defluvii TaxID=3163343 RepID=A0ABV2SYN6_9BACT